MIETVILSLVLVVALLVAAGIIGWTEIRSLTSEINELGDTFRSAIMKNRRRINALESKTDDEPVDGFEPYKEGNLVDENQMKSVQWDKNRQCFVDKNGVSLKDKARKAASEMREREEVVDDNIERLDERIEDLEENSQEQLEILRTIEESTEHLASLGHIDDLLSSIHAMLYNMRYGDKTDVDDEQFEKTVNEVEKSLHGLRTGKNPQDKTVLIKEGSRVYSWPEKYLDVDEQNDEEIELINDEEE